MKKQVQRSTQNRARNQRGNDPITLVNRYEESKNLVDYQEDIETGDFDLPPHKRYRKYVPTGYNGEGKYLQYEFTASSKYSDDEIFNVENRTEHTQQDGQVSLSVVPAYSKVDANNPDQEIPCMISLKSSQNEATESRLGMDIICVIDISGSMSGSKINQVVSTLRFMVELLDEKDLSLIHI